MEGDDGPRHLQVPDGLMGWRMGDLEADGLADLGAVGHVT